MSARVVLVLAVVAVLSVAAAVASYRSTHQGLSTAGAGERLLPELVQKANDVAEITVTEAGKSLSLKAQGEGWVVSDTGFPVARGKLVEAVVGLAGMSRLEPKTANPKKYALIEVDAPGTEGAKGRLYSLKDAKGGVVAEVILGKAAPGRAGAGKDGQYVRLPKEAQSWLVAGRVDAGPELKDWADTSLLSLGMDKMAAARFKQPDGTTLQVKKTGKAEGGGDKFEITGLPAGKKVKNENDVRYAATDLATVEFTDVRPAKAGAAQAAEGELETDKGMKLGFKLVEEGGKAWLALNVVAPGPDKEAADKIAAKVKGWEFQVSEHKAKQFKKRLADLVE
jgi:hypothetical protein